MNNYVKVFFYRGLIFGGFGPIITGIVFLILSMTLNGISLSGTELFWAILSTYILAFVHAGASVFNQIEEWSHLKCTTCHFLTLYFAYAVCYLLNTWIPFKKEVLLMFSVIFFFCYFAVWVSVVISIKLISKKMNKKLKDLGE